MLPFSECLVCVSICVYVLFTYTIGLGKTLKNGGGVGKVGGLHKIRGGVRTPMPTIDKNWCQF